MSNTKFSLKAIIASQNLAGQRFPWLFRYVFIPTAWPLTWVFLRFGIGPNQATFIRLAILLVSFILILWPIKDFKTLGIGLFFFSVILDNVDGCICRVTDTASYFGKFFDGLVDSMMEIPIPLVVAFGFWSNGSDAGILIAGVVASLAFTMTQITMLRYGLNKKDVMAARDQGVSLQPAYTPIGSKPKIGARGANISGALELWLPNLAFDFRYGGLLIAVIFGLVGPYLYFLAALHILMFAVVFGIFIPRAGREMNFRRRSKTAAAPLTDSTQNGKVA